MADMIAVTICQALCSKTAPGLKFLHVCHSWLAGAGLNQQCLTTSHPL